MTDQNPERELNNLDSFIAAVTQIVASGVDERQVTEQVAERLRVLLSGNLELAPHLTAPRPDKYVMRPLHVADDGSFSIACAVWDVGQKTPVHGHETWGVVGIVSGVEHEVDYVKPRRPGVPLESRTVTDWQPGEVTVCCTTDDDVHMVECGSDVPCVGIHVYGGDIGSLPRRSYDPVTGAVSWFVSTWATCGRPSHPEYGSERQTMKFAVILNHSPVPLRPSPRQHRAAGWLRRPWTVGNPG